MTAERGKKYYKEVLLVGRHWGNWHTFAVAIKCHVVTASSCEYLHLSLWNKSKLREIFVGIF